MVSKKEIIAWLKTLMPKGTKFYSGMIDANEPKCIGVFSRRNGHMQPVAIGRHETHGYKSISLLVHWSTNADTCERQAFALWQSISKAPGHADIGGKRCYIDARRTPVDVGTSDRGIYEQVIEFDLLIND